MDLNDYPEKKALPWKLVAIIAGGVVVVIVLVFLLVRLIQGARQSEVIEQNGGSRIAEEFEICASDDDPAGCRENLLENAAQENGSLELCEMLETQEDRDNCFWSVARVTQNAQACALISAEKFAGRCQDDAAWDAAIESQETQECEKILDEGRRSRCVLKIEGPLTSENCADREPELCEDLENFEQGIAQLDVDVCAQIIDESYRLSCMDAVEDQLEIDGEFLDTDEDGLTGAQEQAYGTDSENSDTDGDGYLDGDEVSAGYNPNGSGKIE